MVTPSCASAVGGCWVTANLSGKKVISPQPAKKIVISHWRTAPALPANFEEIKLEKIKEGINAIFLKEPCDLEGVYQDITDLCRINMAGSLYQLIEKECESHIARTLGSLVGRNEYFLSLVRRCWQDFYDQMSMVRGVASYFDYTYVRDTPNLLSLWDMGLQLFRKHLSLASEVVNKVVYGLIQMIESERLGEEVDRTLLNILMKMVKELQIYVECFEKPFLKRTSVFYAAEGVKYMQQLDVPDYMTHVEVRLNEEKERWCLLTQETSTRKSLIAIVERQLLEPHTSTILDKGFTVLMDGNRIEDLQRMYELFDRVNALESLKQALTSYIHRARKSIVLHKEKDKELVSILLELKYASLETILEESFCENEALSRIIRDAFGCL